ncbi:hypothetical protein QYE76_013871 [Lolium multiflorum]|uniref:RING-type domain-containing protein n=1 Tax=Lolium multiflorum TaxID=4521 RepID=A0AAD8X831_LOLMU|nr:hypothetical protein QYE76_013871 [Lolium multiflorum]
MEEAEETPLPAETGAGVDGGAEAANAIPADMDEDADGSEGEGAVEDMDDADDGSEDEEDVEDMDYYDDFSSDDEEEGKYLERAKFVDATMDALWVNADEDKGTPSAGNAHCSVCMDPWTCDGAHRICCIPCGHVYGRSCLEKWLRRAHNQSAKCPQCGQQFEGKRITNLYAPGNLWEGCGLMQEVKKYVSMSLVDLMDECQKTVVAELNTTIDAKINNIVERNEGHFAIFNAQLESMKAEMRKMAAEDGVVPIALVEFLEQNCPRLPPPI